MLRNTVFFFAAFFVAALLSFWPTYFIRLDAMPSWRQHVHGAFLFAWLLMLVAQAWLIRDRRGPLHRAVGKLSYLLAPLIIISGVVLELDSLRRAKTPLDAETLYFAYVVPVLLMWFTLSYGLAIVHRRTPALHMRYMICTGLVMFDPVFSRILDARLGIGFGAGQMITYTAVDLILLWLVWLDRQAPQRVFMRMLAAFVLLQLPTFFIYKTAWWAELVQAAAS